MPTILARNKKNITRYCFRSAPPKNWNAWFELVKNLANNLKKRYGTEEVQKWFFEIWNEPDLSFWSGTQEEYFKLYDIAARAVKETCPDFKVGGPATSKTAWIPEFVSHISKSNRNFKGHSLCDFISTHAYPSDLAFINSDEGKVKLQNSNIMKTLFAKVRKTVDDSLGGNIPLICGEWNSSAGPLVFNHDECNNAAFIAKCMDELSDVCQGSLYWGISDIYEECGFHYQPFHGGYGLITVNDIPKSSYNAFKFLNSLGDNRINIEISNSPVGFGCILTEQRGKYKLLAYYHKEPKLIQSQSVVLDLKGLSGTSRSAKLAKILPGKGSAYEKWVELGSPDFPNESIISELHSASKPEEKTINLNSDTLQISLGTVCLLEF